MFPHLQLQTNKQLSIIPLILTNSWKLKWLLSQNKNILFAINEIDLILDSR